VPNTYAGLWPTDDDVARDVLGELYRDPQGSVGGQLEARRCPLRHH
jgi:hypothetical protein